MKKTKSNLFIFVIIGIIVGVMVLALVWSQLNANKKSTSGANSSANNALIGQPLPAVNFFDADNNPYSLERFKGKTVVLFFSEGLRCYPACWNQIAELGKDLRFNSDTMVALSVISDPPTDWQKATDKMSSLKQALTIFDTNADAARALGLLNLGSSMHRNTIPGHTYVVLDKDGVVRYVYDDPSMSINNDMLIKKIAEFN